MVRISYRLCKSDELILVKERPGCLSLWNSNQWQGKLDAALEKYRKGLQAQNTAIKAEAFYRRGKAFENLDIERLDAGIAEPNTPSCKIAEKIGFILEGTQREAIYINGKPLIKLIIIIQNVETQ